MCVGSEGGGEYKGGAKRGEGVHAAGYRALFDG